MKESFFRFALTFISVCSVAGAANITWDITPGTVGVGDGTITGGTGAWSLTAGNWTTDGGANNFAWDNAANAADTAVFQGTAGTVTLGSTINLGGLRFSVAGYTVATQTLAFGGTQGSIDTSALGTGSSSTTISSALSGTAGLTINANGNTSASGGGSTGRLVLSGTNTSLTGGIAITGGLVNFTTSSAAGSATTTAGSGNALSLSNGGGLYASGSLTLGNNISLASTGGTLRVTSGNTLTLNGLISGTGGGFNKTDSGTLVLANAANTYTGAVAVQAGTLQLGNLAAGSGTLNYAFSGSSLSVTSGTTLSFNTSSSSNFTAAYNFANLTNPVSVTGGKLAFVQTNNTTQNLNAAVAFSGTSTVDLAAGSFSGHTVNFTRAITGTGSLTFTASGGSGRNYTISGAGNDYTGNVILGTASASSVFNLNTVIGAADLTINSANWTVNLSNATHTFKSLSGSVGGTIQGTGASSVLNLGSGNTDTSFSGTLGNGTGTLAIVKTGTGIQTFTGSNTYTGGTSLNGGTLNVGSTNAIGSSGTISFGGGTLQHSAANTTDYSARFSTAASQAYKVDTNGQNVTWASSLTSSGGTLAKSGTGKLTLTGVNTYNGATTVSGGTLEVDGSADNSAFSVGSTARVTGSGSIGALTVSNGGTVSPDLGSGPLDTGSFTLESGGTLEISLNGGTAGIDYSQLNVTGSASLSGLLSLTSSFTPANGDLFFIIANDGTDAISGQFTGLNQGDILTLSGVDYRIGYTGDSVANSFIGGNDVVLMAVPEPSATLLGSLGALALLLRRRKIG